MTKTSDEEIIMFIEDYIKKNGYSPSFRDIAKAVGIRLNAVMNYCNKLKKIGFIKWSPYKARSIVVLAKYTQ